jgi:AAA+ ATPase superfamily predicted ATPase
VAVPKPDEIYDREREWASLSAFASDAAEGATLGLVYGRRRQGKSLLLEALCAPTGGLYHMALEQDEALALRALGEDLGRRAGVPGPVTLSEWDRAIEGLLELGTRRRPTVVVLDEFPYLVRASRELPSVVQRAFGPRSSLRARSRTRLILCGSALSIMGRLLSGAAPLRGRASLDLLVQPFDFRQAAGFWGLMDLPEVAFRVHAIVGGTPAYRDLLRGDAPSSLRTFDAWVARTILDPASPLFREGRYLMAEEPGLADRALYHSILTAIGEGGTRPSQIASVLRRPQTALAHPLNVLEDIRIVQREQDALRQRRPTYHIAEPIVRFYFAVMRPHLPRLDRGGGADVWRLDARASFSSQVLGPHFEDLARQWTARYASKKTLGGAPSTVGSTVVRDPSGRTSHQVDVVAITPSEGRGPRRVLALGEAKWRTGLMPDGQLDRLLGIKELLEARDDLDVAGARVLLFSPAGFTKRLRERAKEDDVAVLVDLQRLYAGD